MLCVIARLSPDASEKLLSVREAALPLVQEQAPFYGHITIATYLPEEDAGFAEDCGRIVRACPPFSVRYERIGLLSETSVIAAEPSCAGGLRALHRRIAGEFGAYLDQWTRDESWRPHTTLIYDPAAELDAVCQVMRRRFSPFETRISRIEFSRVEEAGYRILDAIDL